MLGEGGSRRLGVRERGGGGREGWFGVVMANGKVASCITHSLLAVYLQVSLIAIALCFVAPRSMMELGGHAIIGVTVC